MKINLAFEMNAEEMVAFAEAASKANISSEVLRLLRQAQETQAQKVQDDKDFKRAAKESRKVFKKNFPDEDFSKDFNEEWEKSKAEYEKTRREIEEAQRRFDVHHEQNMKALEELEHELKGLQ